MTIKLLPVNRGKNLLPIGKTGKCWWWIPPFYINRMMAHSLVIGRQTFFKDQFDTLNNFFALRKLTFWMLILESLLLFRLSLFSFERCDGRAGLVAVDNVWNYASPLMDVWWSSRPPGSNLSDRLFFLTLLIHFWILKYSVYFSAYITPFSFFFLSNRYLFSSPVAAAVQYLNLFFFRTKKKGRRHFQV